VSLYLVPGPITLALKMLNYSDFMLRLKLHFSMVVVVKPFYSSQFLLSL
jgi:hypothetical protein